MNAKEIREILEDEIPGSGLWRNQNDNYWDRAMDRIADRILAKSKEEAIVISEKINLAAKERWMLGSDEMPQSVGEIASFKRGAKWVLAAFGKEGEG